MQPKQALLTTLGVLWASAWATAAPAFELFVAKEPVYAVVDGELFTGEARARLDRSGKLAVRSTRDPSRHCEGQFRFTASDRGEAALQCSDGSDFRLLFQAMGLASGHGEGPTPHGTVRFTFGLSPEKATPHLGLPAGARLVKAEGGVRLIL